MLANIQGPSAGWQALLFALAVVCFVLAALKVVVKRIELVAAGLAFAFVVSLWIALAKL